MCTLVSANKKRQEKDLCWLRQQTRVGIRVEEKHVRVENIHSWRIKILHSGGKKILLKGKSCILTPGSGVIMEGRHFVVRE